MPHRKKNTQQQRQWRRMDLHLHTPASVDYKQTGVTYLDLLQKAREKKLDIIAFADHNTANGYSRYLEEVESLELLERLGRLRDDERARLEEYRRLRTEILILPGFEFTATLGFHILGIFPPDTTVRELEHLLLMMRVPPDKLDQGSGEVGATTDALTAYRMIHEAGGLAIAAHANSSHGVAMPGFDFGGQTRIAYTQDPNLDALEVTDLESKSRRRTAAFFSGTKPEYPRRMHCIQSSDAHKLDFDSRYKNEMGVGDRATEILLDDLSFEAIQEVLEGSDFSRTRPYRPEAEEPFDPIREAREQGDNLIQSFHERLHEKRGISRSILEDVVALANTNGGTVYIGASANPKTLVVGVERPEQAGAELRSAISKEITPPLEVQADTIKSQGKNLLQVIVPRGSEAPYALEGSYIYVRSENETGLALRDEIVQLVRDALAVEFAAGGAPTTRAERPQAEPEPGVELKAEAPAPATVPPVEPPRTGVEIVSWDVRKGVTYYSVRDLRNNRIVQNVTRTSARRLWQYAIEEQEKHPCDPDKVTWIGNVGVCKSHKRGGKTRFDLVQRTNGKLFVYYGVTEDGIHGDWRKLVESENGIDGEESVTADEQKEGLTTSEVVSEGQIIDGSQRPDAAEQADLVTPESENVELGFSLTESREEESTGTEAFAMGRSDASEPDLPSPGHTDEQPQYVETQGTETTPGDAHVEEPSVPYGSSPVAPPAASGPPESIGAFKPETAPATPPEAPPAVPVTPVAPPLPGQPATPPPPKSRAQQWREALNRAIADARAAQQPSTANKSIEEPKRPAEKLPESTDTAIRHEPDESQQWGSDNAPEANRTNGEKDQPTGPATDEQPGV